MSLLAAGCSTTAPTTGSCQTLNCLLSDVSQPFVEQCMDDLFRHDRLSSREKRRINETYAYPFTNAQTFLSMTRYGSASPSPEDWCHAYGERITALRFAGR